MIAQINSLKARLRKEYTHMQAIKPDYDCGHELLKTVSTDYSVACQTVNATLEELARLDPTTPTTRF